MRRVRATLGFRTQEGFGEALGDFSTKQVSNAERGANPIPPDMLEALASKYDVDLNWLLTGGGEMFRRSGPQRVKSQEQLATEQAAFTESTTPAPSAETIPKEDYELLKPGVRAEYVPLLARTAAGPPSLETDHDEPVGWAEEFVRVPGAASDCFALRVQGASMAPDYPNGCLVLVGRPITLGPAEAPAVVFVKDEGDEVAHTFKMVRRVSGAARLRPLNEQYRTEDVPLSRIVRVLGVIARIA